tara:strand:+ start:10791 stop:11957 length:1167 start_codon:yes stop_codon:yes gene_type:complete
MIYLDYAATTPVDPRVAKKMAQYLTMDGTFGNPASSAHKYGWQAREAVDTARQQVADAIGADAKEIVFTSGATEANNLAIKGIAEFHQRNGKHIITCKTEHKAVLDTCQHLEKQGFNITYLTPRPNGLVDLDELRDAIQHDTILISIMLVNNETGVIQDLKAIAALAHEKGIYVHTDAVQAMGKIPVDVKALDVDLLSMSAHKVYGPKGVGALYVKHKPRVRIAEQIHGGGHENGMRSGTLATHQIVGMAQAFTLAMAEMREDVAHIAKWREMFWQQLVSLDDIHINGAGAPHVASILNVSFAYIDNSALLTILPELAVSTGSACMSGSIEPSYVLQAMGVKNELSQGAVRFSFGRFTTEEDVNQAAQQVVIAVKRLRHMSPAYKGGA